MSSSISLLICGLLDAAAAAGGTGLGRRSELMRRGKGFGGRSGASAESDTEIKQDMNVSSSVKDNRITVTSGPWEKLYTAPTNIHVHEPETVISQNF